MFCSRIHGDRIDAIVSRESVEEPTPWTFWKKIIKQTNKIEICFATLE